MYNFNMGVRSFFQLIPIEKQEQFKNSKFGICLILLIRLPKIYQSNIFYSQFGEDIKIQKFTPENRGFYVDIGSGDPVRGSNTYKLYKKGWNGILIDPLTRNILLSKLIRRRDKSVLGLVGNREEEITFYEMFPYEYSTAFSVRAQELVDSNKAKIIRKSILRSIIFSKLNLSFNLPTVLNIDCEGFDFEILKTINLNINKFRLIMIEDFDPKFESSEIFHYLDKSNYRLIDRAGPTSIYVLKEYLLGI